MEWNGSKEKIVLNLRAIHSERELMKKSSLKFFSGKGKPRVKMKSESFFFCHNCPFFV